MSNPEWERALGRGRLYSLTQPPLRMTIYVALMELLEQGSEGMIPFDKAVDAAYKAVAAEIDKALTGEPT